MAGSLRFSRIGAMCAAAVFVLLSGCGTTVKLADTRLPDALVEPLPLTAGLRLGENIESFVYEETLPTGGTYTIDLGRASALMFGDTLEDMFAGLVRVDAGAVPPEGIDLLIESSRSVAAAMSPPADSTSRRTP